MHAAALGAPGVIKRRCAVYKGCRGLGWMNDLTDDGSGAQVYCDCPAGLELKAKDAASVRECRDVEDGPPYSTQASDP